MHISTICRSVLLAAAIFATPGHASATEASSAPTANSCPAWVEFPANHHSNAETSYLGCTNAQNLKNMVENPE